MKQWFKLTDSSVLSIRWQRLGRDLGVSPAIVSFVYVAAMSSASACNNRGSLDDFDPEDIDFFGGFDFGTTQKVVAAFEGAGIIESGRIAGWEESQRVQTAEETDRTKQLAAERQRRCRSKKSDVTACHAESRSVTACHAESRSVTPTDQIRTEQRDQKNDLPPTPQGDGGDTSSQNQPSDVQDSPSTYPDYEDYTFLRFYKVYPNKARKQKAYEAWIALRDKGWLPPFDDLIHSLKAQVNHYGWNLPGREVFCESLDKWLTGRRWEDECPDTPYVPPQRDTAPPQRAQASSGGFDMERQRAINAQVLADLAEEENQKRLQEKTIEN